MSEAKKAMRLMEKAICLFESGKAFEECYPILREIEPLLTQCLGVTRWPRLLVRWRDEQQAYEIATSVSGVDNYQAGFFTSEDLKQASGEDLALLVGEILLALKQWKIDIADTISTADTADTADTKTDKAKKTRKKREASAAARVCGLFIQNELKQDPTQKRNQLIKDWIATKGGLWDGEPISFSSIEKQLQDNPVFWKPADK